MKGFILAAGLGTRLKPWTDSHPKALVPVGGIPMLERVVNKFYENGITDLTINCFHFADQIKEFIADKGLKINVVDESPILLETGGAILNAADHLCGDEPILVHNVDILSDADISGLLNSHLSSGAEATLLVSKRESSRQLIFDNLMNLKGWHSLSTDEFRPESFKADSSFSEYSFSGIYIISPALIYKMKSKGWSGKFSIMDFFLSSLDSAVLKGYFQENLNLIDIGKPDSLNRANILFSRNLT